MANKRNYKPNNPHLTQDLKEDSYLWKKRNFKSSSSIMPGTIMKLKKKPMFKKMKQSTMSNI